MAQFTTAATDWLLLIYLVAAPVAVFIGFWRVCPAAIGAGWLGFLVRLIAGPALILFVTAFVGLAMLPGIDALIADCEAAPLAIECEDAGLVIGLIAVWGMALAVLWGVAIICARLATIVVGLLRSG